MMASLISRARRVKLGSSCDDGEPQLSLAHRRELGLYRDNDEPYLFLARLCLNRKRNLARALSTGISEMIAIASRKAFGST